ncbi:MAG: MBL fold hydrolase [Hyphomicrobiales bacterium]|nr:MAG: MBL fold hydrolase [Hyphomicrobiales bacterium]
MKNNGKKFGIDDYEIDIIVTGFPGKSVCHGMFGFSTIAMIRHGDRIALVDVGSFGQRPLLLEQFAERGMTPSDITDVLLTHSHWDHLVNWPMFPEAKIIIGREELEWSLKEPWGTTMVPEFYVKELEQWPNLRTVGEGDEVFPGITTYLAPGHTPGCLVFVLDGGDRDIIFSGDACKNRAELISRDADMTYDPAITRASIATIWKLWEAKPGSIVVPGHDLPMILEDGKPRYLGEREAAIQAWYGEGLDETTIISLT